jgi:hypothetical protein
LIHKQITAFSSSVEKPEVFANNIDLDLKIFTKESLLSLNGYKSENLKLNRRIINQYKGLLTTIKDKMPLKQFQTDHKKHPHAIRCFDFLDQGKTLKTIFK